MPNKNVIKIFCTEQWTTMFSIIEKKTWLIAGTIREKTISDELINIPSHDKRNYTFCRLKLFVAKFGINQSEFTQESTHNVFIKLWEL